MVSPDIPPPTTTTSTFISEGPVCKRCRVNLAYDRKVPILISAQNLEKQNNSNNNNLIIIIIINKKLQLLKIPIIRGGGGVDSVPITVRSP